MKWPRGVIIIVTCILVLSAYSSCIVESQ